MAKSGFKGFIGGFFSLLVISILVFLCIYFFLPDLSVQYFGMTFNNEQFLEGKLDEFVDQAPPGTDVALVDYLSSENAREDLRTLLSDLGNDIKSFLSYITSDDGQAMLKEKAGQVSEAVGSGKRISE